MRKKLLVTMSGGTTCVINSTLAGILHASKQSDKIDSVLAGTPGIIGVLNESMTQLPSDQNTLNQLQRTPASGFIGTTRVRPINFDEINRLNKVFAAHNIGYFINIGGNGTIQQSIEISKSIRDDTLMASLPKTVDNDLGDDEFKNVFYTPGFPSCANYWRHKTHIMNQENLGACSHDKVLIAQTFGRKTGFLAGCARLADIDHKMPLIILLPEDQRDVTEVIEHIRIVVNDKGRAIVVLSEGYDIGDIGERYDLSGQVMYGSSATTNTQLLVNKLNNTGIQCRAFIPGPDQRSEIRLASALDIKRAFDIGEFAVNQLLEGNSDFLASISKADDNLNDVSYIPIKFSNCTDYSRTLPKRWIDFGNFDVKEEYANYVVPLIGQDELDFQVGDGRPNFAQTPSVKMIPILKKVFTS
jgi:6-phosphofructokinase 1